MTDWNPWICTHCKSALPDHSTWKGKAIVCAACGAIYPLIGHETAVLVKDPEKQIGDTCLIMEQQARSSQARMASIEQQVSNKSTRSAVCRTIIDAMAVNIKIVRAIQDKLISVLPQEKRASLKSRIALAERRGLLSRASGLLKRRFLSLVGRPEEAAMDSKSVRTSLGYMLEMFQYLRRDWGGFPLGEEQIARVETEVFNTLREHVTDRASVLVLGAGMARFAWDLRSLFKHVIAIDASILAAMLHAELKQGDIVFYETNERSAYTVADQASKVVASLSHALNEGNESSMDSRGEFIYCVADGRKMPLADRSMSAIVSIYFTDVLPLSILLPEVRRMLAPGGVFVHYGPLDYHFEGISEKYSVEELREVFRNEGFDLKSESWVDDITRSDASMRGRYYHAWCFAAVYRGP